MSFFVKKWFHVTYEIFYCVDCLPDLRTEQLLLEAVSELHDCALHLPLQLVHAFCKLLHGGVHLFLQLLLSLLCRLFGILDMISYLLG